MFKFTNPPDGEEAEGKGGQERGKGEKEEDENGSANGKRRKMMAKSNLKNPRNF